MKDLLSDLRLAFPLAPSPLECDHGEAARRMGVQAAQRAAAAAEHAANAPLAADRCRRRAARTALERAVTETTLRPAPVRRRGAAHGWSDPADDVETFHRKEAHAHRGASLFDLDENDRPYVRAVDVLAIDDRPGLYSALWCRALASARRAGARGRGRFGRLAEGATNASSQDALRPSVDPFEAATHAVAECYRAAVRGTDVPPLAVLARAARRYVLAGMTDETARSARERKRFDAAERNARAMHARADLSEWLASMPLATATRARAALATVTSSDTRGTNLREAAMITLRRLARRHPMFV